MRKRRQNLICCCCCCRRCHFSSIILLLQTLLLSMILIALRPYSCAALSPDGLSLLAFKAAVSDDPSSSLADWNEDDTDPCRWPGISCDNISGSPYPRVVGIAVSGKNLSGYIPSELGTLLFLRRLNLHGNRLAGAIPAQLFNASSLHSLFLYDNLLSGSFPAAACNLPRLQNLDLSKNSFSGSIPPELRGCRQLQRLLITRNRFSGKIPAGIWPEMIDLVQLDLSSNQFNGSIPPDLGSLDSLTGTLNLSHNQFSGKIPESLGSLPSTVSLDIRFNKLSGEIPSVGSLANQGPTAFLNNPGLCGFPLQIPCEEPAQVGPPPRPGSPATRGGGEQSETEQGKKGKLRTSLIVLIAVADAAGVALVGLILVFAYWKVKDRDKCCAKLGSRGGGRRWWQNWCMVESGGEFSSSEDGDSSDGGDGDGGGEGVLVTMDKGFKVELEELLRASAYVLGKGGNGIVYKVVVGDGVAVAVRRLGDGGVSFAAGGGSGGGGGGSGGQQRHWYKEFAAEVAAMGRVRQANVVKLRAYYWAADEKLLISDFISNGNLATALRGRSGQRNLSWSLRLRIAQGAARGLAHIHECSPRRFVHGAVKPSNILLDTDFNPFISDFGLHRLLSLTSSASTSTSVYSGRQHAAAFYERPNPYRAPETRGLHSAAAKPTQKSDVYSFGVVLLEMLTGRSPEMSSPSPSSSASASAAEQVPELVKWVRKGFEEARPLAEMADMALLREAHAKKEVAAAFHVALACTEVDTDARPRMKTVSDNLDRIGP